MSWKDPESLPSANSAQSGSIVNRTFLLFGASGEQQEPAMQGVPIRIEFGDAQEVTRFSLGADGLMTAKVAGVYDFRFTAQAARGSNNGTAYLYFRILKNGSQLFQSLLLKMPANNSDTPIQVSFTDTAAASDEYELQFMVGSEGVDDGYLEYTTPVDGWNDIASASIAITQNVVA